MERLRQVIEYLVAETYNADKQTLTGLLTSDKAENMDKTIGEH